MNDLRDSLARLGLAQYFEVFVAEGFDTWETVLDITESDLNQLGVKLGHRRKLQRAIAESRGQSSDRPLPIALGSAASVEGVYRSEDSATESKSKHGETSSTRTTSTVIKRKYRRHPRPDEHAPERPPSAYVIFSNQVRESLRGQDLSFTEIAKVVGERWQVLPADERESCERQANNAKERYYSELTEYKKTLQFQTYQKYLEDFRAKHAAPPKGKRPKLETERSGSTRSSSHDQRRLSPAQPELPGAGLQRSDSSPPLGPSRLPAGPPHSSKPSSPATRNFPRFNSPGMGDPFSPVSISPRSATFPKEAPFDASMLPARDRKVPIDANLPYQPYTDLHQHSLSRTPPSYPRGAPFATSTEFISRRSVLEPTRLPPLTRDDTTLSSESGHSGHSVHLGGYPTQTPLVESGKTLRILPQPVPATGPPPLPLGRLPPPPLPHQPSLPIPYSQFQPSPQDYRIQGPMAVLVRAGEIVAREAEPEPMGEDGNE